MRLIIVKAGGGSLLTMKLLAVIKTSLDITWLKDKSLADLYNLPDPHVLAEEIAENFKSAFGEFYEGDQAVEEIRLDYM